MLCDKEHLLCDEDDVLSIEGHVLCVEDMLFASKTMLFATKTMVSKPEKFISFGKSMVCGIERLVSEEMDVLNYKQGALGDKVTWRTPTIKFGKRTHGNI